MKMGSFMKGVAAIASGTAVAQAIQLGVSPIIARLYQPEHLGGAATLLALVGVLLPWATLGFSSLIVVVGPPSRAVAAYRVSQTARNLFCGALAILLLLTAFASEEVLRLAGGYEALIFLIPVLLISTTREMRNLFLSRLKMYAQISKLSITQTAAYSAFRVVGGLVVPSVSALLLSYIAALAVQTALSKRALRGEIGFEGTDVAVSRLRFLAFAKRHRDYVHFRAPQASLSAVAQGLPVVMVSSLVGLHEGGIVALAKSVTAAPLVLVGQAVSVVALAHFSSKINEKKDIFSEQLRATALLASATLLPVALLAVFGPDLFAWVFGERWRESGQVARALSPLLLLQVASRPSVSAMQPLGLVRWHFKFEIAATLVKAASLYIGYLQGGYLMAILAFSVASAFSYGVVMGAALRASKSQRTHLLGGRL
jgi:O-antigen/teichoic acid export membrane protein